MKHRLLNKIAVASAASLLGALGVVSPAGATDVQFNCTFTNGVNPSSPKLDVTASIAPNSGPAGSSVTLTYAVAVGAFAQQIAPGEFKNASLKVGLPAGFTFTSGSASGLAGTVSGSAGMATYTATANIPFGPNAVGPVITLTINGTVSATTSFTMGSPVLGATAYINGNPNPYTTATCASSDSSAVGTFTVVGGTGPTVTGPTVTGPTVTGPTVTGPTVTGPTVTGPTVTGPTNTGPSGSNVCYAVTAGTGPATGSCDLSQIITLSTGGGGCTSTCPHGPLWMKQDGNTIAMGTVNAGSTATKPFNTVTVTDDRGTFGGWTLGAKLAGPLTGAGAGIPASAASIQAACDLTAQSGALDASVTICKAAAGPSGGGAHAVTGSVSVAVPSGASGAYTGTLQLTLTGQ